MDFSRFESKPKWLWIIIVLILGIAMLGGGLASMQTSFDKKYVDVGNLFLGFIMFLGGLGFLSIIPFYYPKIIVEGNSVTIKSLFINKSFLVDEIMGYETESKTDEYGLYKWEELTIYFKASKFTFYSSSYKNYEDLKARLCAYKKAGKPKHLSNKESLWKFILFNGLLTIMMLFAFNYYFNADTSDIKSSDIGTVYGVIVSKPTIEMGGKDNPNQLNIHLKEYPDFTFKLWINDYNDNATNDFLNAIQANDTISLDLKREDANRKIKGIQPLSFWDKHYKYDHIEIFGLGFKNVPYVTIEQYNAFHIKDDASEKWASLLIGIFLAVFLFFLIRAHFKKD
jgi:hypothetical protein